MASKKLYRLSSGKASAFYLSNCRVDQLVLFRLARSIRFGPVVVILMRPEGKILAGDRIALPVLEHSIKCRPHFSIIIKGFPLAQRLEQVRQQPVSPNPLDS